jgi:hypothetical protein
MQSGIFFAPGLDGPNQLDFVEEVSFCMKAAGGERGAPRAAELRSHRSDLPVGRSAINLCKQSSFGQRTPLI